VPYKGDQEMWEERKMKKKMRTRERERENEEEEGKCWHLLEPTSCGGAPCSTSPQAPVRPVRVTGQTGRRRIWR
jgi:hypothetical protein